MAGQQRHALAQIDRRTPAERNDPVAALSAIKLERGEHRAFARVGRRIEEHGPFRRHGRLGPRQEPAGRDAVIGNEQRPADVEIAQRRAETREVPGSEIDRCEIGDTRH
jgi:hypothetical protein